MTVVEKVDREEIVEWSDVRAQAAQDADGSSDLQGHSSEHARRVSQWKAGERREFTGANMQEMGEWLRDGFSSPELDAVDDYTPTVKKRRQRNHDEGDEIMFDRAWSGDPTPFVEWEQRERKPGLKIVAEYCFAAGTPVGIIQQYGAWLAGMMSGLETKGYDLDVSLEVPLANLFTEERRSRGTVGKVTRTQIRITREGEQSDFKDFSPLFSPGGWRMLGFTALEMVGQRLGKRVTGNLGTTLAGGKWDVEFSEQDRTLRIRVPQRTGYSDNAKVFPADAMTEKVKAATGM